ncbi:MAG: pyridoxal phosphate-dependent aminotransferase [Chitinispirillia bacterium]|jgi:aspartate/methionine/tyrosine aminotransferase
MTLTPINPNIVRNSIVKSGLKSVGLASIRETNRLVLNIEKESGEKFIRMEMGIPGLPAPKIAVNAEIEALKNGVGSKYPPFDGIPELKIEISLFIKNFINVSVKPAYCIPTVGSMQGCFMSIMVSARRFSHRNKILFIDPGFPVNKIQTKVIGIPSENFDVYNYRGDTLRNKLESYLVKGDFGGLMYSNPNNPSWICFTDKELQIIGDLCTKYDVIALEDLAYFGMDFRKDYSKPGVPPFIPSVSHYTDKYILLISSSKSFSLAGQRIGMTAISNELFTSEYENLLQYFNTKQFGYAFIFGAMYALSSGVSHSAQYGLYSILKASNEGTYNYVDYIKEYGERAKIMKKLFIDNGFHIVYDKDDNEDIADGFYFTIAHKGFTGPELVEELLYYGISSISLTTTGSDRHEGLRACVSLTGKKRFAELEKRLKQFHDDHKDGFKAIEFYK